MKTHTVEIKTWTLEEHPNKDACLEWVRENWHDLYAFGPDNVACLKGFCDHFDLSRPDYEISMCSHSWATAKIPSDLEDLRGVRLWKYLQNNVLADRDLLSGNCPFTGYCMDENLLDPLRAFIKKPTDIDYQELIDDCLASWVKAYVADWEYCYSDDGLTEHLESNEYEFTETGKVY